jgi:TP901 family phage tail tape measure protein
MAFDLGTAVATLQLNAANFVQGLSNIQSQFRGLGESIADMGLGQALTQIGSTMTETFTRPIVGAFQSVVSAAGDFEASVTNVRKTTDASAEEYNALAEWAKRISTEIPVAATKLLDIGEIIGQMGVELSGNREEFQKYIEVAAKLAYTTDMTSASAANFMGRFSTLMKVQGEDIERLGATLVDLGNKYNGTESQIAALALRLTGAANVVNMSAQGVMGLAGAMVNVGLTAETGGSSMSRFMENIDEATYSGGEKLETFAKLAGVSSEKFVKAWRTNPEEAILNLITNMAKMKEEGGNVYELLDELDIGTIRYKDTILRLVAATDKSSKAMADANTAWSEATALEEEAGKRKEDFNSQLEMTKNAWENLKVEIGTAFLPVLKDVLHWFIQLFERIRDNVNPEVIIFIGILALVLAGIGPLVTAIGTLIAVLQFLAANPIIAVVTVLVGLGIAIANIINSANQLSDALKESLAAITPFQASVDALRPSLMSIDGMLSNTGKTVGQLSDEIKKSEEAITTILSTALKEHRSLRQEELDSIRQHNEKILELQQERLQMYRDRQLAELRKLQLEEGRMTQESAAQLIANSKAAMNEANRVTEESYTARLITIENKYKAMGQVGSQAHLDELREAKTHYDSQIAGNRSYYALLLANVTNNAAKWNGLEREKWEGINSRTIYGVSQYKSAMEQMDLDTAEAFLSMVYTAKKEGAVLEQETLDTAAAILNAFNSKVIPMGDAGKDLILGLIGGIKDKEPALRDTEKATAADIVATFKNILGIESPSTVFAGIGGNIVEGLYNGIDNKKSWLQTMLSTWAGNVIGWIKGVFGIKSPSTVMRDVVGKQLILGLAEGITGNAGLVDDAMAKLFPSILRNDLALQMGRASAPSMLEYGRSNLAQNQMGGQGVGGVVNNFVFNSPTALDPVSMQRQFESVQKRQSLLLDLG